MLEIWKNPYLSPMVARGFFLPASNFGKRGATPFSRISVVVKLLVFHKHLSASIIMAVKLTSSSKVVVELKYEYSLELASTMSEKQQPTK